MIRVWGGIEFREGIQEYAAWPGPEYVIATGALWALCGSVTLIAFWRRAHWADRALLGAALAYVAWLWFDRLVMQAALPTNWPFALATNALMTAFTVAVAVDPRNRYYLRSSKRGP